MAYLKLKEKYLAGKDALPQIKYYLIDDLRYVLPEMSYSITINVSTASSGNQYSVNQYSVVVYIPEHDLILYTGHAESKLKAYQLGEDFINKYYDEFTDDLSLSTDAFTKTKWRVRGYPESYEEKKEEKNREVKEEKKVIREEVHAREFSPHMPRSSPSMRDTRVCGERVVVRGYK